MVSSMYGRAFREWHVSQRSRHIKSVDLLLRRDELFGITSHNRTVFVCLLQPSVKCVQPATAAGDHLIVAVLHNHHNKYMSASLHCMNTTSPITISSIPLYALSYHHIHHLTCLVSSYEYVGLSGACGDCIVLLVGLDVAACRAEIEQIGDDKESNQQNTIEARLTIHPANITNTTDTETSATQAHTH